MGNRRVKCGVCGKGYPSKVEQDYSGECADCEELTFGEKMEIGKKRKGSIGWWQHD